MRTQAGEARSLVVTATPAPPPPPELA